MTPAVRKQAIQELTADQAKRWDEYCALGASIKGLQDTCQHDWSYSGHGHNYDVYTCTICGAEEER